MRFAIVVTGPAYDTRQASSASQLAQALIAEGHELSSIFLYREGVCNANQLTLPTSGEFNLACGWQQLNAQHGVTLNICVAAALHHGVVDKMEAGRLGLTSLDLQSGFTLNGLDALAEASLACDRVV